MAMCVGVCALLSAAVVGAQPGDEEPVQASVNVPNVVAQARSLMSQIETLHQNALKAANDAQSSRNSVAIDCTKEIVQMMAGPYKFSKSTYAEIEELAKQDTSQQQVASEIENSWQHLTTYFETMVTLHGRLQGCGGPSGGSIIDGAPLTEKQNNMKTTTDPTASEKSGNDINDLQVSAEQSGGATVVSLGN
jgi:hypothetical protein